MSDGFDYDGVIQLRHQPNVTVRKAFDYGENQPKEQKLVLETATLRMETFKEHACKSVSCLWRQNEVKNQDN